MRYKEIILESKVKSLEHYINWYEQQIQELLNTWSEYLKDGEHFYLEPPQGVNFSDYINARNYKYGYQQNLITFRAYNDVIPNEIVVEPLAENNPGSKVFRGQGVEANPETVFQKLKTAGDGPTIQKINQKTQQLSSEPITWDTAKLIAVVQTEGAWPNIRPTIILKTERNGTEIKLVCIETWPGPTSPSDPRFFLVIDGSRVKITTNVIDEYV